MCDFSGRLVAWMDRELPGQRSRGCGAACPRLFRMPVGAFMPIRQSEPRIRRALRCGDGVEQHVAGRAGCPSWRAAAAAAVLFLVLLSQHPSSRFLCARQWHGRLAGHHPGNCAKAGQDMSIDDVGLRPREDSKRELGGT